MNSNKAHSRFVLPLSFLSPLISCSPDACSFYPTRFQSSESTKSNSSRFLSWTCFSVYYVISHHFGFSLVSHDCQRQNPPLLNLTYPRVTYNFVCKRYCYRLRRPFYLLRTSFRTSQAHFRITVDFNSILRNRR